MSISKEEHKIRIDKYGEHLRKGVKGGYTTKTRKRLLGITEGLSGRDRSKNVFWDDVRKHTRMDLIDLEIFLNYAQDNQVKQVITSDLLKPIIYALFLKPVYDHATPDLRTARIAQLFIKLSFEYLSEMRDDLITSSHSRTIQDAVDLSNFLGESFKSESTRKYSRPFPRKPSDIPTRFP